MILEHHGFEQTSVELAQLDEAAEVAGFLRWQWEYYRATYDHQIADPEKKADYFLRINTRVTKGKLEDPEAELAVTDVYIGRATFPHGVDYTSPIPQAILDEARLKLKALKKALANPEQLLEIKALEVETRKVVVKQMHVPTDDDGTLNLAPAVEQFGSQYQIIGIKML
jgi:hypothetical protein